MTDIAPIFWQAPSLTACEPMTLERFDEGVKALQARTWEPLHFIRGGVWCDVCGPRQYWIHSGPLPKLP